MGLGGSGSKESACNGGDMRLIPGSKRSLEKGMVNHSSILAWTTPRTALWVTVHEADREMQMELDTKNWMHWVSYKHTIRENNLQKKKVYIYTFMYKRIIMLHTWNEHDIVNQLYSNLKHFFFFKH